MCVAVVKLTIGATDVCANQDMTDGLPIHGLHGCQCINRLLPYSLCILKELLGNLVTAGRLLDPECEKTNPN